MRREMSTYERKQLVLLEEWKHQKPGFIANQLSQLPYRLEWLLQGAVPERLLHKALDMVDYSARWLADEKKIVKSAGVDELHELQTFPLEHCDRLALGCQRWAVGFGAIEGGATGVTGLSGLAADIPALLTLSIRTIYQIGYCYGCNPANPTVQQLAFTIMAIAITETNEERQETMRRLQELREDLLCEQRVLEVPLVNKRTKGTITARQLGRHIGANLIKRKALQTIPALGAIAGSSINAWYINEVSITAKRVFQEIWFYRNMGSPDDWTIES